MTTETENKTENSTTTDNSNEEPRRQAKAADTFVGGNAHLQLSETQRIQMTRDAAESAQKQADKANEAAQKKAAKSEHGAIKDDLEKLAEKIEKLYANYGETGDLEVAARKIREASYSLGNHEVVIRRQQERADKFASFSRG